MVKIADIIEEAEMRIYEAIATAPHVRADEVGLDFRAGFLYVTEEAIIVEGYPWPIQYYGGFEYVNEADTETIGVFTIYFNNDERVEKAIEYYFG